jgi:hypothetical protein
LRAELHLESKLLFRVFASETTFPSMKRAPSEKIRRLIKAVEDFDQRTKSFCPDVRAGGNEAGWNADALRAKFWDVSVEHLGSVLETARYDDGGNRISGVAATKTATYDDAVFVPPPETQRIDTFFDDPAGGMLLVAPSGLGKSTVLCDTYLKRLRAGDLAVFLTGRHLRYAALEETLDYLILRGMRRDKVSLASFERFLGESGKSLVVFVDAVNEYTGEGGAAALLESIVAFVQNQRLRGVRVVAGCRSETWARYRERTRLPKPLAGAHFYTDDAIVLTDLDEDRLRAQLYSRYRDAYALAPASFRQLGNGVKGLVRTPLMMALIAQTYASKRVPVEVDYFALFDALTRRKLGDAQQFVSPDDPRSKYFQAEMRRGLERFTELLFEQLRSPDRLNGVRDALAIDVLAKDAGGGSGVSFAELMQGADDRLSVYEALLQTRLIEEVVVAERDSAGGDDEGHAVHFFHDQYAQYRLGLAYERADVLGRLDFDVLDDSSALDDLTNRIAALVESSLQAPILAGALQHWLHAQLARTGDDAIEYDDVVPLLSRMAEHPASIVRDVARRIVTDFAQREVLPPQKLYEQSLRRGSPRLQRELASAYIDYWPGVSTETTRAFVLLLTVPYHLERAPSGTWSGEYFISQNVFWTVANFRQLVAEIRALVRLVRSDYDRVGLIGLSSGGFQAGLATLGEDVDFLFPVMTVAELGAIAWESLLTHEVKAALIGRGVSRDALSRAWSITDLAVVGRHSLARRLRQYVTLYDAVMPLRYQERLWQVYGEPPRVNLPTSHYSVVFALPSVLREIASTLLAPDEERVLDARAG